MSGIARARSALQLHYNIPDRRKLIAL